MQTKWKKMPISPISHYTQKFIQSKCKILISDKIPSIYKNLSIIVQDINLTAIFSDSATSANKTKNIKQMGLH